MALVLLLVFAGLVGGTDDNTTKDVAAAVDSTDESTDTPVVEEPTPELTPERADVPKLVGQGVERAKSKLTRAGLDVDVKRVVSVKRPGTVLRQSSRAGRQLLLGSAVTLVVSAPWPRVPNITGLSAAKAASKLRRAGFRVATVPRRTTSGRDEMVLSQNLAGKTVRPHSTVRLVVSDYHKPAPPPPPPASNCTTGYDPCLPPMSDYDCAGGSGNGPGYTGLVRVTGSDPYDLDADGDGIACED